MSAPLRVALVGIPNCGKTALFNRLTGSRAKVANYAGVTVEKRSGLLTTAAGPVAEILDLPGTYSLHVTSYDERVTRELLLGHQRGEAPPVAVLAVVDACNLRLGLRLVLELKALGRPLLVALNQIDLARQRGLQLDRAALEAALGLPVVETIAIRPDGAESLKIALGELLQHAPPAEIGPPLTLPPPAEVETRYHEVEALLAAAVRRPATLPAWQDRLDSLVLHPWAGPLLLLAVLFLMFQAVYAWSAPLMDGIDGGIAWLGASIEGLLADGPLKSLLVDGVIAGAGSVLVFLPQILILFAFILAFEDSGYLPRAAMLLDRPMRRFGLSGRAFIPLLSSFACAIPGILATRTIQNPRERLLTILLAPLMTCSARLPVYALLIGAFIPERSIGGVFNLQGLTLFALYLAGIGSSAVVAAIVQRSQRQRHDWPLLLELPGWRLPNPRQLLQGLIERARLFLARVGGVILAMMVLLWGLSSFPGPPPGATEAPIYYSVAGLLGRGLEWIFAPVGFNWQICIALVPGLAAREVAVGALGTVYALSGQDSEAALASVIAATWSLPTALALLAWYVYAPMCLPTLAVARRETNSWRWPLIMAGYLFGLAWIAAFVTYRVALWATG
jgi:ferrous iron transport protein B